MIPRADLAIRPVDYMRGRRGPLGSVL